VKIRSFRRIEPTATSAATWAGVVIIAAALGWGCSAGIPESDASALAISNEQSASSWNHFANCSAVDSPAAVAETSSLAHRRSRSQRSHDNHESVRSGHTDPRWVLVSDSRFLPESQQVLEVSQFYSEDGGAKQIEKKEDDDYLSEWGSEVRENLKATTFLP